MTIKEVATQLYNCSVAGYINGVKFTKSQFIDVVRAWMTRGNYNSYIGEICLPDGRWLFKITKWADRPDGYDYYIPDTAEQNSILMDELLQKG